MRLYFRGPKVALLIGIDDYTSNSIHSLKTPVKDMKELEFKLKERGDFEHIKCVKNPKRGELITEMDAFRDLITDFKSAGKECLAFLYYAGMPVVLLCCACY